MTRLKNVVVERQQVYSLIELKTEILDRDTQILEREREYGSIKLYIYEQMLQ